MHSARRLLPWLSCSLLLCILVFLGLGHLAYNPLSRPPPSCTSLPSFDQVWSGFKPDSRTLQAAVYTPYHISPGGGEKYLLSIVQALQYAGFEVGIYTYSDACRDKTDLMATAAALRVTLDPARLSIHFWDKKARPRVPPRVFFALGNAKFPIVRNQGQLGFFMCQFPFDLDKPPRSKEDVMTLTTYDYVLVNSHFTYGWYNSFISPSLSQLRKDMVLMPSITILHPPCAMLSYDAAAPRSSIIMLGRFFSGRQNKGHAHAIRLFAKLASQLPEDVRLVLVGQLAAGHEDYVGELQELVQDLPAIASRVDFVISATPELVAELLGKSAVQWHMTGLEVEAEADPASREHFGISIVEGMSAGSIPIALFGGPSDIIQHGVDGFLAFSEQDFSRYTLQVFGADAATLQAMRSSAVERAAAFSYDSFQKAFLALVHHGLLSRPYRHFISATLPAVRTCSRPVVAEQAPMTAMILEGSNHYALEYVIYNVMSVLHKSAGSWSLHIFHSGVNRQLVRQITGAPALSAAQLHELPSTSLLDPANFTRLMKSEMVWRKLGSASKVLVFGTDSLIVNPGIERFLHYDYIGAPWSQREQPASEAAALIPSGVGSGGFSLRSVPLMKEIARQYGKRPNPGEPEDVFYAQHVTQPYQLGPRPEAYDFCIEAPCSDLVLSPDAPVGLHAAWLHTPLPTVQRLLYQSFMSTMCDDCLDVALKQQKPK